jgi:nicotinamidase-related amidase
MEAKAMDPYVTTETLEARTLAWMEEIAPINTHIMRLDPERAALLVVDMQQFFLDPASPSYTSGGTAILPNVERLLVAFREAGRPVIYTRHVHHPEGIDAGIMGWWWEGMCVEGSPESQIHPRIAPLDGEKVVEKHRYSAFYNTDLETVLRGLRVEDLVICGVMTNMCCESTARDAYYRDLRVFFLADGTGAPDEDMHLASLLNLAYGFAYVTRADRIIEKL